MRVRSRSSWIFSGGYEAAAQQPVREQVGNPHRVLDAALSAGNVADVHCVREDQLEASFEDVPDWLPVDPGRFHGQVCAVKPSQPIGHLLQLSRAGAERRTSCATRPSVMSLAQALTDRGCTSKPPHLG